jgi:hypothetical protein
MASRRATNQGQPSSEIQLGWRRLQCFLRPSSVRKDLWQRGNAQRKYKFILACSLLYDIIYAKGKGDLGVWWMLWQVAWIYMKQGVDLVKKWQQFQKEKRTYWICIYKQTWQLQSPFKLSCHILRTHLCSPSACLAPTSLPEEWQWGAELG